MRFLLRRDLRLSFSGINVLRSVGNNDLTRGSIRIIKISIKIFIAIERVISP